MCIYIYIYRRQEVTYGQQDCIYLINFFVYFKMHFTQCWFIINVRKLWYYFQDSMKNTKLQKNSIYLKYNFCNNNTIVKKLEVSIIILFVKKFVFIQQGFVKFIETVILNFFWIYAFFHFFSFYLSMNPTKGRLPIRGSKKKNVNKIFE